MRALFRPAGAFGKIFHPLFFFLPRYHLHMNRLISDSRRVALACGLSLALMAQQASALFVVNQPWVRPAQQARATEAYMNLTSTDGASLVGAASTAAAAVAILAPGKTANKVDRVLLPAERVVALAPAGYRIALRRLARTLKVGDRVQLSLTIEAADGTRQEVGVNAEVRLHSPIDDEMHAHTHGH
jgi:copper(I)-binding protein